MMAQFRMAACQALGLCMFLTGLDPVAANQSGEKAASGVYSTRAEIIDEVALEYPARAGQRGEEGWVLTSFVVQTDGSVKEASVVDSSGKGYFEREALRAIEKTKFKPATLNGQPVESCLQKVQVYFVLGEKTGAQDWFVFRHRKILSLSKDGKFAEAAAMIEEVETDEKGLRQYELTRLELAKATVLAGLGKKKEALSSYRKAIRGKGLIEEGATVAAYVGAFSLEVEQKNYGAAYATYNQLKAFSPEIAEEPQISSVADQLGQIANSSQPIVTGVSIENGKESVFQPLLRREFGFSNISGRLDTFKLYCDFQYFSARVNTTEKWKVPESWGACELGVFGSGNTTFNLAEF